jgi:hypothetical protein
LRRGWWRITDAEQLQTIVEHCHPRGVRERELKRTISRFMEYVMESSSKVSNKSYSEASVLQPFSSQLCAPGDTAATELAITDEDHKVSALPGGAPLRDSPDAWSIKVALRVDMLMLEQVEALEDRVANASMQIKVLTKREEDKQLKNTCAVSSFRVGKSLHELQQMKTLGSEHHVFFLVMMVMIGKIL